MVRIELPLDSNTSQQRAVFISKELLKLKIPTLIKMERDIKKQKTSLTLIVELPGNPEIWTCLQGVHLGILIADIIMKSELIKVANP